MSDASPFALLKLPDTIDDQEYFKRTVWNALKLTVVVEFIMSNYTLNLFGEIVLLPVVTLLAASHTYASSAKEHAAAHRLIGLFLGGIGFALIGFAIYQATIDIRAFASVKTLSDFVMPPILTFIYLPFVYFLVLYSRYELTFIALKFAIEDDSVRKYAEFMAIASFRTNRTLLQRWKRDVGALRPGSNAAVRSSIREVLRNRQREMNPQTVDPRDGWSPHIAKSFLAASGLPTNDYHRQPLAPKEWLASLDYHELGEGFPRDSIGYYVEGDETAVTQLKLVLNVNGSESAEKSYDEFVQLVRSLSEQAIGTAFPLGKIDQLDCDKPVEECFEGKIVRIEKDDFAIGPKSGYRIEFVIAHPKKCLAGNS